MSLRRRIPALVCALALIASGCGGGSPAVTHARRAGLEAIFEAQTQLMRDPGSTLDTLRRLGADRVRVFVSWGQIAPDPSARTSPAGFDASDPAAYPAAGWASYDALVRAATKRGIGVFLSLGGPPPLWASGPGAPGGRPTPQWKPSARAFGNFVHAIAIRYGGSFTPSGASAPLPRVNFWSIWNEPNYGPQLAPQSLIGTRIEIAPRLYRDLVDAAWAALSATGHGSDTILLGELAPRGLTFDDMPGNFSGMVPLRFLRALYCVDSSLHMLRGAAASARGCPADPSPARFVRRHPALFDATGYAVHPYPQGGVPPNVPTPFEPDYADLPALPRLESTLDALMGLYGSHRRVALYDSEFGYQTDPPERIARALDPHTAAYYLNWAEYISWRDPRIRSWNQYLLTDPPRANALGGFATGLEFADGRRKALYDAYRMPVFLPVTSVSRGQAVEVWGCARPARFAMRDTGGAAQVAQIQFEGPGGTRFRTIKRVTLTDRYFDMRIALPASGALRLAWSYPRGPTIYSRTVAVTVR